MQRERLILTEVLPGPDATRVLGRLDEDKLMFAFARWAEARLRRWVDFARGALLFLSVVDQPESGMFYVYDRETGSFWMADLADSTCWGGYREEDFDELSRSYGLRELASRPKPCKAAA